MPDSWSTKTVAPRIRQEFGSCVDGPNLYCCAGRRTGGGSVLDKNVDVYNMSTDAWTTLPGTMTAERRNPSAAFLGGKLYVIGGFTDSGTILSTMSIFDGTWSESSGVDDLPEGRWGAASCVLNGKIYLAGGSTDLTGFPGTIVASALVYEPGVGWSSIASMSQARTHVTNQGIAYDDRFWVFGGENGLATYRDEVEVYDPATNAWTSKADIPIGRSRGVVVGLDDFAYVLGANTGGAGGATRNDRYDLINNSWAALTALPGARSELGGGGYEGRAYVVCGIPEGGAASVATNQEYYAFDPATPGALSLAWTDDDELDLGGLGHSIFGEAEGVLL